MAKTINTINNANETTKGSKENTKNQKIFGSNKGHFVMYRGRGRRQFLQRWVDEEEKNRETSAITVVQIAFNERDGLAKDGLDWLLDSRR